MTHILHKQRQPAMRLRQLHHGLIMHLALFLLVMLPACTHTQADNERQEALLDSARTLILCDMDYTGAEKIYQHLIRHTRNKLIRLQADEGMMKLCQIRSLGKQYYDYRSDAQKILHQFQNSDYSLDPRSDSILRESQCEYYRISAVYYINLRDMDKTADMLDSLQAPSLPKKQFLAQYLGTETPYYQSLLKVWTAEALTDSSRFQEALDTLSAALHIANSYHLSHSAATTDTLHTYQPTSATTTSTEMQWIHSNPDTAIPDWIAAIREQLSITYGAMGNKAASDYNHNIYFDILDATRQDMQVEQQLDALQAHATRLNLLLISTFIITLLLLLLISRIYVMRKRANLMQQQALREQIQENLSTLLTRTLETHADTISQIQDQMEYADDSRRAAEMQLETKKRSYIDKAASVSIATGIMPFLDRALRSIDSPSPDTAYITELIEKINQYNDTLAHWVKIRQGAISLNVETFSLSQLFYTAAKARKLYEAEGLTLQITPTDAVVKADKALTIFMINTLMDNARKFTPSGGTISIYAETHTQYVEISIQDTGCGFIENDTRLDTQAHKGHGFGLINCRGIIEKYKKTSPIFSVCHLGVESKQGEGSRFYFRLPPATGKQGPSLVSASLGLLLLLIQFAQPQQVRASDYIDVARSFADSVYYSNATGDYHKAIQYSDSVITALNMHYIEATGRTDNLMLIEGEIDDMPEIRLWNSHFDTDYDIIIDVRNELAIAALAINRKHLYRYNCDLFTRMYHLVSQDTLTSQTIASLSRTNDNKTLILNLTVLLLLLLLLLTLMYYYHTYTIPLFNLREILNLDHTLPSIPQQHIQAYLQQTLNDIIPIDHIQTLPTHASVIDRHHTTITQPLTVNEDDTEHDLGTLVISLHANRDTVGITQSTDECIRYIAQYLAVNLYCIQTKIPELHHTLELKLDQQHLAEAERNRIHVANTILDNCLSSIKHETTYYPNRIKQLLTASSTADISAISQHLHYYKDILTALTQCAIKQTSQTPFKRKKTPVQQIVQHLNTYNTQHTTITLNISNTAATATVTCDPIMLHYLFDTLIQSPKGKIALTSPRHVHISLTTDEHFLLTSISDPARHWTEQQASELFYPDTLKYQPDTDTLKGAEYIICKQIIREHDEHCGTRGCRIIAQPPSTLTFTLPLTTNNNDTMNHES